MPDSLSGEAQPSPAPSPAPANLGADLTWVWKEVRKRVFIKLPFSLVVADALAAAVPIALDGDTFVVGLSSREYTMAGALTTPSVKNTVENILRQAAGRTIMLEVIEGITLADWEEMAVRRQKAQAALLAMAEQKAGDHHFDDVLNQIVGEIRHRISQVHDRVLPQVRAGLILDIAPSLADAEDMLFGEHDSRESRRAMSRVLDRIAGFLEVPPVMLSLEVERHRRATSTRPNKISDPPS
ncbi:hypothetical protein IAD21_03018 [Abditibacteriota bacterium]|nr:hypothetical protein IAD21_03018 [Abditibacteriota bacterium]